jgi:MbtH protein
MSQRSVRGWIGVVGVMLAVSGFDRAEAFDLQRLPTIAAALAQDTEDESEETFDDEDPDDEAFDEEMIDDDSVDDADTDSADEDSADEDSFEEDSASDDDSADDDSADDKDGGDDGSDEDTAALEADATDQAGQASSDATDVPSTNASDEPTAGVAAHAAPPPPPPPLAGTAALAPAPTPDGAGDAGRCEREVEDSTIYVAVVNHEEQYSIWPADRELPLGWTAAGKTGLKCEVLAWVSTVWTDMRPESLRKKMAELGVN